jgi:hypothetical protein
MSKIVQWKRGNTSVNSTYIGAAGEITVDTDVWAMRVHDGSTAGGHPVSAAGAGNLTIINQTIAGTVANGNIILDPIGANSALIIASNVLSVISSNGILTSFINNNLAQISTFPWAVSYTQPNTSLQLTANLSSSGITIGPNGHIGFNTQPDGYTFKFNGSTYSTEFYAEANFPTGYQFTTPQGLTGMSHTYQNDINGNISLVKISHDNVSVAKFYDNATTQLTGNLVVTQSGNIFGAFSNAFVQTYANVNSYSQLVAQNINRGNVASTDFVATADNGTDSTYYIDMGITSSNACVASFFGDTTAKDDGYLYIVGYNAAGPSTGNIGNLIIGSTNGLVKTFIGNTSNANVITTVSSSGLSVNGNVVISGNLTVANITYLYQEIISNTDVVAANLTTNALTVNNSVTIGTTLGVTGNVTAGNLTINSNISGNTAGFTIGYRDIPQVVFTSNATLALTDAGKHYFSANSANVITIPNNTTVSFNIGTAISIIQQGTANLTVTPGSGVTLYLAGNSISASRNVGNYGMATLVKVNTNTWFINGSGIT